jgi:hypothetical protein
MTDNAKNNAYIIPYLKSLRSQITEEVPPVVIFEEVNGNPIIETNCVRLNSATGDAVESTQRYTIDANHGFVFQCNIPLVSTTNGLYVGMNNDQFEFGYGAYLSSKTILIWTQQEPSLGTYNYNDNDFFQIVSDGFYINFILNGKVIQKAYIDDVPPPVEIWIGWQGSTNEEDISEKVVVTQIYAYQTGIRGEDGVKGADCNSILSTYKDITNVIPNLQNYGIVGDYYRDKFTNNIYGPKLGLCGSLYFDGTAYNGTGPVIPTLLSVPNSADIQMGSGDFTIEWFQYLRPGPSDFPRVFSIGSYTNADPGDSGFPNYTPNTPYKGASIAVSIENNGETQRLVLWINSTSTHDQGVLGDHNMGDINVFNKWAHIAIVRSNTGSGGLYTAYVDGASIGNTFTGTDNLNDWGLNRALTIGGEASPINNTFFSGHITNFKWTKGTAIYTGNFNVSLVPLTTTNSPKILLNANNYYNRRANNGSGSAVSEAGTVPVSWNVANPFFGYKTTDAWAFTAPQVLYDPPPFVTSITEGATVTIWNFNNGRINYNSLLFYISFGTSTDVLDISSVVIVAANYNSTAGTVAYKQLDGVNLPNNINLVTNNSLLQITQTVADPEELIPEYPHISVKVIALDNNTSR